MTYWAYLYCEQRDDQKGLLIIMSGDDYDDEDSSNGEDIKEENPIRNCVRRLLSFPGSRRTSDVQHNNRGDTCVGSSPKEYAPNHPRKGMRKPARSRSMRPVIKKTLYSHAAGANKCFHGGSHNGNAKSNRTMFTHCFNAKDCANNALAKSCESNQAFPSGKDVSFKCESSYEGQRLNKSKSPARQADVEKNSSSQTLDIFFPCKHGGSSNSNDSNKLILEPDSIEKCDPETKAKIRREVSRCMKEEIERAKACVFKETNRMRKYFENADKKRGVGKQINIDPRSESYLQTLDYTLKKHCMEEGKHFKNNCERGKKYSDEAIIDEVHQCQEFPQVKRMTTFNCASMMGKSKYPRQAVKHFQSRRTGYIWSGDNPRILKRDRPGRASKPAQSFTSTGKKGTNETNEYSIPSSRSRSYCAATRTGSRPFCRNFGRQKASKSWSPPRFERDTSRERPGPGSWHSSCTKALLGKKTSTTLDQGDGAECLTHKQLKVLEALPDYITLKETRFLIKSVVDIIGRRLKAVGQDTDVNFSEQTQIPEKKIELQSPGNSPSFTPRSNRLKECYVQNHECRAKSIPNSNSLPKTSNVGDLDDVSSGLSSLSVQLTNTKGRNKTKSDNHCSRKRDQYHNILKRNDSESLAISFDRKLEEEQSRTESYFKKYLFDPSLTKVTENLEDTEIYDETKKKPSSICGGVKKYNVCSSKTSDTDINHISSAKYEMCHFLEHDKKQDNHSDPVNSPGLLSTERKELYSLSKNPFRRYPGIQNRHSIQEKWTTSSAANEISSHSRSVLDSLTWEGGQDESRSNSVLRQETRGPTVMIAPNMRDAKSITDFQKDDATSTNASHSRDSSSILLSRHPALVPCPHGNITHPISQSLITSPYVEIAASYSSEKQKDLDVKELKSCVTSKECGSMKQGKEETLNLPSHCSYELPSVSSTRLNGDQERKRVNQSINQRSTDELDLDALSCSPETVATSTSFSKRLQEINSRSIDTSLEEWKSRSTKEFVHDLSNFQPAPYDREIHLTGANELKKSVSSSSGPADGYKQNSVKGPNPQNITLESVEAQSNSLHSIKSSRPARVHDLLSDRPGQEKSVPSSRFSTGVVKFRNPMTCSSVLNPQNFSVGKTNPFVQVVPQGDHKQSLETSYSDLVSDQVKPNSLRSINSTMSPNTAILNEVKSNTKALLHEAHNRSSFDLFAQSMMHIDQPDLSRAIDLVESFSPIKPVDVNTPYPNITDRRSKTLVSSPLDRKSRPNTISFRRSMGLTQLNDDKKRGNLTSNGSIVNVSNLAVVEQSDQKLLASSGSDHTQLACQSKNGIEISLDSEKKLPLGQRLASRKDSAIIDVTNKKQTQRPVIVKTYRPHSAIPIVLKKCLSNVLVKPTSAETTWPRSTTPIPVNLVDSKKPVKESDSRRASQGKPNKTTSTFQNAANKNLTKSGLNSSLSYTICSKDSPRKADTGTSKHIGQTFRYEKKERGYSITNKSLTSVTSDDSLTDKNMSFNATMNDTSEWNYSENNNSRKQTDSVSEDDGYGTSLHYLM